MNSSLGEKRIGKDAVTAQQKPVLQLLKNWNKN